MEYDTIWQQCKSNKKKDIKEEKGNTAIYRSLQCNEVTAWLSSLQEDYTKLSQ